MSIRIEGDGFAHSPEAGCLCPGCCLDGHPAEDGPARGLSLERAAQGLARAAEAHARHFAASPDGYLEQQARWRSVANDTNTGDADQGVDALISGNAWDRLTLTYSFPDSISDFSYTPPHGFAPLSASVKTAARAVLGEMSDIAPFTFTELTGSADRDADLAFAGAPSHNTAFAWQPSDGDWGGDSWYGPSVDAPLVGTWDYTTVLHEVGHALGLKHGQDTSGPGAIPYALNSMEFSVMTYYSYVGHTGGGYTNSNGDYAQSLMMLDIAAIQRIYGANFNHEAGDTVYTFSTTTGRMYVNGVDVIAAAGLNKTSHDTIFRTIWDGNGVDTYDFSNYSTPLGVDLAPGGHVDLDVGGTFQRARLKWDGTLPEHWSRGHIYNALQHNGDTRSLIENAKGGSGNDWFRGNAANNTFWGNGGNDRFYDSAGSDTYHGGNGLDELLFDGLFSAYSFGISGSFLQVIGSAIDLVAATVEEVVFGGSDRWSFAALWDRATGGSSNTAPVASDDSATTAQGTAVAVAVLANDSDADGDALSVSGYGQGANGSVSLSGNVLTYTPDAGWSGSDSFTYSVSDGRGGSDSATVSITVDPSSPPAAASPFTIGFEGLPTGNFSGTPDLGFSGLSVNSTSALNGSRAGLTGSSGRFEVAANGADFDFDGAMFRSVKGGATIVVQAYDDGVLVGTQTVSAHFKWSSDVNFGAAFDSIDRLVIDADRQIRVDDLDFTVYGSEATLPPPDTTVAATLGFEGATPDEDSFVFADTTLTTRGKGVVAGAQAGQSVGDSMSFSTADSFDFVSGWFTAVDGRSATLTIEGWMDGVQVATETVSIRENRETEVTLDSTFDEVDQVVLVSSGGVIADELDVLI